MMSGMIPISIMSKYEQYKYVCDVKSPSQYYNTNMVQNYSHQRKKGDVVVNEQLKYVYFRWLCNFKI